MALTKVDDRGLKTPIDLLDNEKIRLGTGNDLELFHDGNNSRIEDTGTGYLAIRSNNIRFENAAANEALLYITENGAVELYHDNTKRFETFSSGAVVTGLLGIGTSSPDRTIHCHNSSNTTNVRTKFSNGTTGEGASDGFEIGINASDPAQAVLVNYENSPMAFFTNATERLRIDESGNTHFGSSGTLNDANVVSIVPADGRISFGMDGRSSFVTSESGAYIYSGDGVSGDTIAGDLILQSRSNQDRTIRFVTGSSPAQRLSITNNGLLFGTDTAAANALNDYEEGSWTATVSYGSGGYVSANNVVCRYVKVGGLVHVSGRLSLTGGGSGELAIGGLPYAKGNPSGDGNSAGIQIYVEGAASNITNDIVGLVLDGNTVIYIRRSGTTGSGGDVAGLVDGGTTLLIGGSYTLNA